jgi:hypothetical protein
VWWSALDNNNNFIDLGGPSPSLALATTVKKEDAEESSDFNFGSSSKGGGGDSANSHDFSTFNRRH